MSNLLKYHNVKQLEEKKRVIDSNDKVAERIKELLVSQRAEQLGEEGDSEFIGGLFAESVEVVESEKEKEAERNRQTAYEEIVAQAKEQAASMLEEASAQAQLILENARVEGENKGYEEGCRRAEDNIQKMKEELEEKEKELERDYKRKVNELEPVLVDVLADVFERVFHVQFDDKKSMVLHLAKNAMDKIENSREFLVRVPKENYTFVKERQDELEARVGKTVRVEVIEDMLLKKNQCVIETDSGVFDCSLDIQMERLLKDLKSLSI
ncbi:FliH/SctL family protein [Anaerosacchariphilus polymeriproducens]|uniref:Flagellar assembly protein FliH/Type III secretion system HrpE domain-containing protein n=1 Tax=Anaerosacchariphilus polymeriproducens TaxID=1812858 RepID=A0A371ASA4_9FIRM|nr:FliH/SctL family protein [Anaerosacchariphilus polymeriproducens]RDU22435.1 hypothetical protein DWV06_14170 [Anaerosacchariphilus polymeriproducens]